MDNPFSNINHLPIEIQIDPKPEIPLRQGFFIAPLTPKSQKNFHGPLECPWVPLVYL